MAKKKILLLITNLNFGGAQRVFHDLSTLLSMKHDVVECVFNTELGNAFPSGNRLISLDVGAGSSLIDKLYCLFQRVWRLRQIKKELAIDVCISHLEGADLVNVLSGASKTVTWVHGSKRHDRNISGFLGWIRHHVLIPYIYRKATRVVTVSSAISEELQRYYNVPPSQLSVSHNFFDVDTIAALGAQPVPVEYDCIFSNRQVLVFSGRLVAQKDPAALISWFAAYERNDAVALVILGDGELRDDLLKLSRACGLRTYHQWEQRRPDEASQVYFLGYQPNPHAFVSKSDVFMLTSRWEGFPMVIGEALTCGVPVVAADCPTGPLELLTTSHNSVVSYPLYGEFGVLLPILEQGSHSLWNAAISKLLDDIDMRKRYAAQGPLRAQEFSKERSSLRIHELVDI